jgi:hypothetical protein
MIFRDRWRILTPPLWLRREGFALDGPAEIERLDFYEAGKVDAVEESDDAVAAENTTATDDTAAIVTPTAEVKGFTEKVVDEAMTR